MGNLVKSKIFTADGSGGGGAGGFTTADNGLQDLGSSTIGLGGTLDQNTNIDLDGNSFAIEDTGKSLVLGQFEIAPSTFVPFHGLITRESPGNIGVFGRWDTSGLGGDDQFTVAFIDQANQVVNGLNVYTSKLALSLYAPDGSTQVGFTAYDGTGGFTHTADMFYYDVASDIDLSLIQAKSDSAMLMTCYDVTPGFEKFHRFEVNTQGLQGFLDGFEVIHAELSSGSVLVNIGDLSGSGLGSTIVIDDNNGEVIAEADTVYLNTPNLRITKTITPTGTTGDQVINTPAGSVNFAPTDASITVTNSLVDANSIILLTRQTDLTLTSVSYTATSGAFTITPNNFATTETRVDFLIIN